MSLFGSFVTGLGQSLFGSILGGASQAVNDKRSHEYRLDEMQKSMEMQKSYQDWLNKNAFKDQMQSVRAAGMNPMFMQGSVPGTPGLGSPSSGSGSGASASYAPMDLLTMSQIENIKADTKVKQEEAKNKEADTIGKQKANDVFDQRFLAEMSKLGAETTELQSRSAELLQNVRNLALEGELTQKNIDWFDDQALSSIKQALSQSEYYDSMSEYNKRTLVSVIANYAASTAELYSRIGVNKADELLKAAQSSTEANRSKLVHAQFKSEQLNSEQIRAATSFLDAQEEMERIQIKLADRYGDANAVVNMVTQGIGTVAGAFVSGATGLKMLGKAPTVIKGFGR